MRVTLTATNNNPNTIYNKLAATKGNAMFNIRSYEYEPDGDVITLHLLTGGKLQLNMNDEYLAYYGGACDIEIGFISDDLKELFFMVDDKVYAAYQLVQWAQSNHDDIRSETLREEEDEAEHIREVSSPFLSGRI